VHRQKGDITTLEDFSYFTVTVTVSIGFDYRCDFDLRSDLTADDIEVVQYGLAVDFEPALICGFIQ
jgi:hypothetical protein